MDRQIEGGEKVDSHVERNRKRQRDGKTQKTQT
jgi:hypothetical protein